MALKGLESLFGRNKIDLVDKSEKTYCHGYYSSYIPLNIQSKFDDEYLWTFPYFSYLDEQGHKDTKLNSYSEIS